MSLPVLVAAGEHVNREVLRLCIDDCPDVAALRGGLEEPLKRTASWRLSSTTKIAVTKFAGRAVISVIAHLNLGERRA